MTLREPTVDLALSREHGLTDAEWGIMPSTLPRSLVMPAMFAAVPFGFVSSPTRPSASQ